MKTAQTYHAKMVKLAAFGVGAAVLAGLALGWIMRHFAPGENFWLVYPAILLTGGLALAATLPWWRKLDDIQKSGHLVSWYWGGLVGALMVLLALFAATGDRSEYTLGGMAVFLGQTSAYGIAWVIWRLRLIGPAE